MKTSFKKAFKIFKYLLVFFSIVFWVYMVIDDFVFIEKYWEKKWVEYLATWMLFYLVYLLIFSFYYWGITSLGVFVYHKLFKRNKLN